MSARGIRQTGRKGHSKENTENGTLKRGEKWHQKSEKEL